MSEATMADLRRLQRVALAYRESKPVLVALHYDLFTRIARGRETADALARELRLDAPALALLLDALVALGFLAKAGARYRPTPLATRTLVADSPEYMGNSLKYHEHVWDAWSDLRFVLRNGKPRIELLDWIKRDFFTADYIKAMGDVSRVAARELAAELDWRGVRRTLDVGSGAGNFTAEFLSRRPEIEATMFDLPKTLRVAKGLLARHPGRDRLRLRAGNYLADSLGRNEFDLILISNVTRVEDEKTNRMLVGKAYQALAPGGRLVIHDFVIEPDRTGPRFSALLGLHLLVFTGKGRVYSLAEYGRWLRDAGFGKPSHTRIAAKSPYPSYAIVARKP